MLTTDVKSLAILLTGEITHCITVGIWSIKKLNMSIYLQMLDPIQNHALQLCLGAFRTSPSSSLSVLANEPPLYVWKKKLSIQYSLKLSSHLQNPSYNTVFNSKLKISFERKLHQIPPVCIRIQSDLRAVGFLRETFWNVQFRLLLLGSSKNCILISLSKTTPHQKSIEISSSSSVIITRFLSIIHRWL